MVHAGFGGNKMEAEFTQVDVSIIIPIFNGSKWIDKCFDSILQQTALATLKLEICVCNDASTDNTNELLKNWSEIFKKYKIDLKIYKNDCGQCKGVGYGKNKAISISSGEYLCFQDIDDYMLPNRILDQFNCAKSKAGNNYIIGSKFIREPVNSTVRYTNWANSLTLEKLNLQIYTSHGPTVIMPTWFCHRDVFDCVEGFSEEGRGTPEDLIFFYQHLDLGGHITRIENVCLVYVYHQEATTFSIKEETIWNIRLIQLAKNVLKDWDTFTIWNAGKQGRRFYKSLSKENQNKVIAMCDVDINKIGKKYVPFSNRKEGRPVQILNWKDAKAPFVICVKMDMSEGIFESYLSSLNLTEGIDYVLFS